MARNNENPALSADIGKVLLGIKEAQAQHSAASQPTTENHPPAHVLVSNYGRYGTLH